MGNPKCGKCGQSMVMGDDMWYCQTCYVPPDTVEALRAEVERLKGDAKELTATYRITASERDTARNERDAARAELARLESEVNYAVDGCREARAELETERARVTHWRKENARGMDLAENVDDIAGRCAASWVTDELRAALASYRGAPHDPQAR